MRAVFTEIIDGDVEAVRRRLEAKPAEARAVAARTPKKYAGQSTLQVAYRHGRFAIVPLLLEAGADPNFIEDVGPGEWAMPVLHHAVRAAVQRSRWLAPTRREDDPWVLRNTSERADEARASLEQLLDSGADATAVDTSGTSALDVAISDARQVLPRYRHSDPDRVDPKPLNPELVEDLTRVFRTLITRGVDVDRVNPN